jgi:hypothetical protein
MRARSREINIFNMSLLDILCGALGAFCFMMLVLMPYYKPPQGAAEVQKKQQELQDELKKLNEMKDHLTDANAARDLEELVKKLQAKIQELQGLLNQALKENEQLKELAAKLQQERDQAVAEAERLRQMMQQLQRERDQAVAEAEQLRKEKQQLLARNQQLEQENNQLKVAKQQLEDEVRRLRQRAPFVVRALTFDPQQDIGLYIYDPTGTLNVASSAPNTAGLSPLTHPEAFSIAGYKAPTSQPPFDPHNPRQPIFFPGDITTWVNSRGVAWWMVRDVPQNAHMKVYVSLANAPEKRAATTVHINTLQSPSIAQEFPDVRLTPERPWIYMGEIYGNPGEPLGVKPATQAEQEAEWKQVNSVALSKEPLPRPGSGGPHGPGLGDGDHSRSPAQRVREPAVIIATINTLKAKISEIKAHPATDRQGAEKQAADIATYEERIKVLESELPGGGK